MKARLLFNLIMHPLVEHPVCGDKSVLERCENLKELGRDKNLVKFAAHALRVMWENLQSQKVEAVLTLPPTTVPLALVPLNVIVISAPQAVALEAKS